MFARALFVKVPTM